MNRQILNIVLHCTATPQNTPIENIQRYWREVLKWRSPGYHIIIRADGQDIRLATDDKICNGVAGHNRDSIHISYIGGVDARGRAIDNRTDAQIATMIRLLREYKVKYPNAQIVGHRDFPGVKKECPSFDVKNWLKNIKF